MKREDAGQVVALLNAGFPRDALEPTTVAIWVDEIARLVRPAVALEAARLIVRNADRFPTMKEFRVTYRQELDKANEGRELEVPFVPAPPPSEAAALIVRMDGTILGDLSGALRETTQMTARPVWKRWMRRRAFLPLLPPTDAEKHDAILVLRDVDWPHELVLEAERIFIEGAA